MLSLFRRARAGVSLTPGERAVLKLVGGIVATGVVSAILAAAQVVSGTDPSRINWHTVAQVAVGAGSAALWSALAKYYKAHGDSPLGAASPASPGPAANFSSNFSTVAGHFVPPASAPAAGQ